MIMKETPVNKIMENTLEKMRQMVDVSTIIGEPMVTLLLLHSLLLKTASAE